MNNESHAYSVGVTSSFIIVGPPYTVIKNYVTGNIYHNWCFFCFCFCFFSFVFVEIFEIFSVSVVFRDLLNSDLVRSMGIRQGPCCLLLILFLLFCINPN